MAILKHHHISFKAPPDGGVAEWESKLARVQGVKEVRIDAARGDVFVEYDLAHCSEEAVERWMVHEGFVLDDHLMERVKRGWIHYTEENEIDALKMNPRSCCDVEDKEAPKKGPK
jgi:copper chaperone CopZ